MDGDKTWLRGGGFWALVAGALALRYLCHAVMLLPVLAHEAVPAPTLRDLVLLHVPYVPLVAGDLDQILDNLLANALDVTPQGRSITVEVDETEHAVEVVVADEGPGMSEAERARAFDRFWQGPGHKGGSSGLGLAIVRQLARRNGAEVELAADGESGGLRAEVHLTR